MQFLRGKMNTITTGRKWFIIKERKRKGRRFVYREKHKAVGGDIKGRFSLGQVTKKAFLKPGEGADGRSCDLPPGAPL